MPPNDVSWKEELPSAYGPLTSPPTTSSLLTYAHSLTWQGKQQDPTGLIHFGARYYDPCSGRFLSPDPISYPISLNAYSYGNGDPINFRDPDGRFASAAYRAIDTCVMGCTSALDFAAQQIGSADFSYEERIRSITAYQNNPSIGLDPFKSVRFQGGMRTLGGFIEGKVGAGLFMTPTFGLGQFVGSLMMAHGYDNLQSGLKQAYTGTYHEPATIPFLKSFGLSHENAHRIHETVGLFGTTYGLMKLGIQSANMSAVSRLPKQIEMAELYRVVMPKELADIQKTGIFRNLGDAEGKYFTSSIEGASSYAKQAVNKFGDQSYTLVKTRIPSNFFNGLPPTTVDGGIPAWVVPDQKLEGLIPEIVEWMAVPK